MADQEVEFLNFQNGLNQQNHQFITRFDQIASGSFLIRSGQDAGCRMSDTGCRIPDTRYQLPDI